MAVLGACLVSAACGATLAINPATNPAADTLGSGRRSMQAKYTNLPYGTASPAQVLDLLIPDGATLPLPVVVRIHGGAFLGGSKSMEETGDAASAILAHGYALASIEYRMSGEAKFPAGAQDVKRAVRWLRANAMKYGLDTLRFASWGESAGGWFAVMLGVTGDQSTIFDDASDPNSARSSAVQAVVDWYGPIDFATMDAQNVAHPPIGGCTPMRHDPPGSPESRWLGGALADPRVASLLARANLTSYIGAARALPKFVVAHGTADCLVPWGQSQQLADALARAGNAAVFSKLAGYAHGDPRFESLQTEPALSALAGVFGR